MGPMKQKLQRSFSSPESNLRVHEDENNKAFGEQLQLTGISIASKAGMSMIPFLL